MYKNLFNWKITLLILFFIPVISFSQDRSVAFGVKAGSSFNSFAGAGTGIVAQRVGFMGGVFLNVGVSKLLAIQPEVLFQQGGATNTINGHTDVLKLNYAQVPLLFKLRLPIEGVVFPHVFAGPDFYYRVGATYTTQDVGSGVIVTGNDDNIQRMGVGGVVGAGIDIQLEHLFLSLDGRYGANFTNLGNANYELNIYNKYLTIMAGIGVVF